MPIAYLTYFILTGLSCQLMTLLNAVCIWYILHIFNNMLYFVNILRNRYYSVECLVCTQISIHLPCYWMVKFIFHFRGSLSYLWQVFWQYCQPFCPKEDSKHTPNTLLSSIKSKEKSQNQTKSVSNSIYIIFRKFFKKYTELN